MTPSDLDFEALLRTSYDLPSTLTTMMRVLSEAGQAITDAKSEPKQIMLDLAIGIHSWLSDRSGLIEQMEATLEPDSQQKKIYLQQLDDADTQMIKSLNNSTYKLLCLLKEGIEENLAAKVENEEAARNYCNQCVEGLGLTKPYDIPASATADTVSGMDASEGKKSIESLYQRLRDALEVSRDQTPSLEGRMKIQGHIDDFRQMEIHTNAMQKLVKTNGELGTAMEKLVGITVILAPHLSQRGMSY